MHIPHAPTFIRSFYRAERELKEAIRDWNNTKIYQELQQKEVKWTFHPPTAVHPSQGVTTLSRRDGLRVSMTPRAMLAGVLYSW